MGVTATDELRRMLDERGVEWEDMSIRPYACTSWRDPDGEPCTALEGADDIPDGRLSAQALLTPEQAVEATLGPAVPPPPAPDQPPYDVLLDILASEWGIDASWDGLRRFWCVELNDEGVRKRDELHAENDRLRELVRAMWRGAMQRMDYAERYAFAGEFVDRMRELGVEVDD